MEVFLGTSIEEYDEKLKKVCTMFDRKIQDICEKVGGFYPTCHQQPQTSDTKHYRNTEVKI